VVELGHDELDGWLRPRRAPQPLGLPPGAGSSRSPARPPAGAILAARDAGVHEFLRKPYSMKDLVRRLEAVTLRDRDWVEGVGYIGPTAGGSTRANTPAR
jgi:hypothetical protein